MSGKIADSETICSVLFRALGDAAILLDEDGRPLKSNEAARQLLGGGGALALSRHVLFAGARGEERWSSFRKALEADERTVHEEQIMGQVQRLVFTPLVDPHSKAPVIQGNGCANPDANPPVMLLIATDITELRTAEEEIRREQQRYRFLMESLPGLAFTLDATGRIRYANRFFKRYFKTSGKDDITCQELLCASDGTGNDCPPLQAILEEKPVHFDWTFDDGMTFAVYAHPMTDPQGETMAVVLGVDVTPRVQAEIRLEEARQDLEERVLERTAELEDVNKSLKREIGKHKKAQKELAKAKRKAEVATQTKSSFLANMSHEIRTPLNAMLGMTDLALREGAEGKQKLHLEMAREAGKTLLNIINDILDFSKIEADKLTLERIDFNLRDLLDSALNIHSIPAYRKGLELGLDAADDLPTHIRSDPTRLKQILVNLLSNAIKFTSKGSVRLSVTREEGPRKDTVRLWFTISDTGIGIPREKRDSVFETFQQADDTVTRSYGGTGLGLAICRLLVQMLEGEIHLDSEEGKGTMVQFSMVTTLGEAPEMEAPQAEDIAATTHAEHPRLRILLVEDNALNRELVVTALQANGHEVVQAENGPTAVELGAAEAFDVVLMDIQMPGMDGVTATKLLRDPSTSAASAQAPIIALTAHALKGDKERFLDAGMDGYIAKPINLESFESEIYLVISTRGKTKGASKPAGDSGTKPPKAKVDTKKLVEMIAATPEYDREQALSMLAGNAAILTRLNTVFQDTSPNELNTLETAIQEERMEDARTHAHSIKGAAATIGCMRLSEIAKCMEYAAAEQDMATVRSLLPDLRLGMERALKVVNES